MQKIEEKSQNRTFNVPFYSFLSHCVHRVLAFSMRLIGYLMNLKLICSRKYIFSYFYDRFAQCYTTAKISIGRRTNGRVRQVLHVQFYPWSQVIVVVFRGWRAISLIPVYASPWCPVANCSRCTCQRISNLAAVWPISLNNYKCNVIDAGRPSRFSLSSYRPCDPDRSRYVYTDDDHTN